MLYILGSSLVVLTAAATKTQVEDNLQFMLNISVALAPPVTSLLPLSPWIVQSREGKALCPEAVHAAWEWMCFFPSRSSLLAESCWWWLGPDLAMDDVAHGSPEPCGYQVQYLPVSLQAACQRNRDMESRLWKLILASWLNKKYWVDRTVKYIKNKFFVSSSTAVASSPYLGHWMQVNSCPVPD